MKKVSIIIIGLILAVMCLATSCGKNKNFEYEKFFELSTKVNELISRELEQYAEKKIDYKQYEMREELLSKLLGSLQSPITNLARVLNQIAEQGGAADVAVEAAPAEEAAVEETPATEE